MQTRCVCAQGDVSYSFDLDPGPVEAEKIAVVVDFSKANTTAGRATIPGVKADDSVPYLGRSSPAFIRAVGQLNAKLGELADAGVYVFVGSFFYFNVAFEAIDPHVDDEEYVQRPAIHQRVLIAFSERDDDFILKPGPREWEREQSCYERAAEWNYKRDRHPDLVDERVRFPGPDDFLVFNREYWFQRKACEQPLKAVAAPAHPNITYRHACARIMRASSMDRFFSLTSKPSAMSRSRRGFRRRRNRQP